jgi:hypothetical protein
VPETWKPLIPENKLHAVSFESVEAKKTPSSLVELPTPSPVATKKEKKERKKLKKQDSILNAQQVWVDFTSITGFQGLPQEWEELLQNNKITKEECLSNHQTVLRVLEFHNRKHSKSVCLETPLKLVQQESNLPHLNNEPGEYFRSS